MSPLTFRCLHISSSDHVATCFMPRDIAILESFTKYRYLTSRQIERLHFRTHVSQTAANRACRRVLARLTATHLLRCMERRIGGLQAGSSASVYSITPVGENILLTAGLLERKSGRKGSGMFLEHTLRIAEAAIVLTESVWASDHSLLAIHPEPHCWRSYASIYGTAEYLKPDMHAITASSEYEYHFFVEIDLGTESLPRIIRKCREYTAYWQTGIEQERHGVFPYVIWIAPNMKRAARMMESIANEGGLRHELFSVITSDEYLRVMHHGP